MTSSLPIYCTNCGAANQAQAAFCFACGLSLQTSVGGQSVATRIPTGLLVSNHLLKSRYRIIRQAGKGGMGAVYKAEDALFGNQLVAIKEMSQSGLNMQEVFEVTESFKREAYMLAGLSHPNLPKIRDYFSDTGRWYLVMDFIEGETLEDYLNKKGGRLPVKEVLDIGIQLCTVLDYLHTRQPPIIFRDLKPSNVMRTPNGAFYLIDFGIARHFKPGQVKDTASFGSAGYAPPEQYGKAQTTPRSDIYSLGAMLHQLLSGEDPSQTPFQFTSLSLHGQYAPASLEILLIQMLEMNANKRPTNMGEIKQILLSIAAQIPGNTSPPSTQVMGKSQLPSPQPAALKQSIQPQLAVPLSRGSQQRMRLPSLALGKKSISRRSTLVILATLATGSGISWLLLSQRELTSPFAALRVTPPNAPVSITPTPISTSASTTQRTPPPSPQGTSVYLVYQNLGAVNTVAWAPNGKYIASGCNDGTTHVWDAHSGITIATYKQSFSVYAVVCSPDSTRIASGGTYDTLNVWEVFHGNTLVKHQSNSSPNVYAVAWSPDGRYLASANDDGSIEVWNALTGEDVYIYMGHTSPANAVAWSPNGKRIASASDDRTVQVWDATTGNNPFIYSSHTDAVNAVAWSPDSKYIASGSTDQTVHIWEAAFGKEVFTYHGHLGKINTVAWSPKSQRIASGSADTSVQVWDAATGTNVFVYGHHTDTVKSVAWSPDGTRIVSGSYDQTVQVWQAK